MNRQEAIQRIIWSLLANANAPHEAVAAAFAVKPHLGDRAEADFRNLLRAAGLFARDDDGFFMRYVRRISAQDGNSVPSLPLPTHLLTVPVPVEPRMRIAYSIFMGLLLKHLYQCHAVVPLQVSEGMALLWAPKQPNPTLSPLPNDAAIVWKDFQHSPLAEEALRDGIEATLSAIGKTIGGIAVTDSMARSTLLRVLLDVLVFPRHERAFQTQGGMRLDFYARDDIDGWAHALGGMPDGSVTVGDFWESALTDAAPAAAGKKLATLLVAEAIDQEKPMSFRSVVGLWRGEGTGTSRKRGRRDEHGWQPRSGWTAVAKPKVAEQIEADAESALRTLDLQRKGTQELDRWADQALGVDPACKVFIADCVDQLTLALPTKSVSIPASEILKKLLDAWPRKALTAFLGDPDKLIQRGANRGKPRAVVEMESAISETCRIALACKLAQSAKRNDLAIFDWPLDVLRTVSSERRFALRFIKKSTPRGAKKLIDVEPFGSIVRLADGKTEAFAPFVLENLTAEMGFTHTAKPLSSESRCIVCGSSWDLLKGAISFLPETKKRWYETPASSPEEPEICSNCAFVAYLSAIYPKGDTSVVEFPADNFLELFALHEHLQGISGAVALKTLNRVGALSILPSRYLLLSKNSRRGQMDSKTQIYAQLRHHTPLLQNLDRPMRVQIEGGQPSFWSEVHPHVAVGLSHFADFPEYWDTRKVKRGDKEENRKILAQEVTKLLVSGRPFEAIYRVTETRQSRERNVLKRGVRGFEDEFVRMRQYGDPLARALGGGRMSCDFFEDVIDFSNYLLALCQPLVKREVRGSGSSVSGIARKFTDLIAADFGQCRAAKFLYVTCQRADQAEKAAWWAKRDVFAALYPTAKGDAEIKEAQRRLDAANVRYEEAEKQLKQASDAERAARADAMKQSDEEINEALSAVREAWDAFRAKTPRTELESRLDTLHQKHGGDAVIWRKFLREVEARTLALLLLNVHRAY